MQGRGQRGRQPGQRADGLGPDAARYVTGAILAVDGGGSGFGDANPGTDATA